MDRYGQQLSAPWRTAVELVDDHVLASLSDTPAPQGAVAVVAMPALTLPKRELVLILDGLRDPGNIGTLLRWLWRPVPTKCCLARTAQPPTTQKWCAQRWVRTSICPWLSTSTGPLSRRASRACRCCWPMPARACPMTAGTAQAGGAYHRRRSGRRELRSAPTLHAAHRHPHAGRRRVAQCRRRRQHYPLRSRPATAVQQC